MAGWLLAFKGPNYVSGVTSEDIRLDLITFYFFLND